MSKPVCGRTSAKVQHFRSKPHADLVQYVDRPLAWPIPASFRDDRIR